MIEFDHLKTIAKEIGNAIKSRKKLGPQRILVTGGAGFIGSQLLGRLTEQGHNAVGIDNFNSHLYDASVKRERVRVMNLTVLDGDLRDEYAMKVMITTMQPTFIFHLGALAGVRDSYGKERDYHSSNIDGTQTLIEQTKAIVPDCRVIYASTSSVYSSTKELPWKEDNVQAHQLNPYSYTKYANECMFKMSGLNNTGLRFFTVYGPWGRPDMALFDFTKKILAGEEIEVYNYGDMKRDFTFVDDIIDGILCVMVNPTESGEIYNIGRGRQVPIMDFIGEIEKNCGVKAIVKLSPPHPADALETWSDTSKLEALGYSPSTDIVTGIKRFYEWYVKYN